MRARARSGIYRWPPRPSSGRLPACLRVLAKQDPVATLEELQAQLDRFVAWFNDIRPHRAKRRRPPREAWQARIKATPSGAPGRPFLHYRIRNDRVDKNGKITLRHEGRLRHLNVGRAHKGLRVLVLVADRDVRILSEEGELLSHVVIDPAKNYQAQVRT